MLSDFYKKDENDAVWWVSDLDHVGRFLFSFDKEKVFNLFEDYPEKLTDEQLEIFNRENPYWREFFKDRLRGME